jgi:hypothetical protein
LINAGSYTREMALHDAEKGDLIAFERHFISNVSRIYSDQMAERLYFPLISAGSTSAPEGESAFDAI